MDKKKYIPGMSDAENVFEEIEAQEKALRRKEWLEEHKKDAKPRGGDNTEDKHQG